MSKVIFIGAGKMASAIVTGILKQKHFEPQHISCTCGNDPTGPELAKKTGITYQAELAGALDSTEIIVLACKPQQLSDIDETLVSKTDGKLIISILAGITLERLSAKFKGARAIVRAMPNTPGQIGEGITGYATSHPLDEADNTAVKNILTALGEAIALPEAQIDAVTAISGSGPAYLFEFTAALREAAKSLGLPDDISEKLAVQTIFGAASLLKQTEADPETLRDNVTSPGGTTHAALESLKAAHLRPIMIDAVTAARDRSIELSKM